METNTQDTPANTTPESFARLFDLTARKARMLDALRSLPAQIEESEAKVAALRAQIAAEDIAFEASADGDVPASTRTHKKQTDARMGELLRVELDVRRLRDRLAALEPAIQDLDGELAAEIRVVRNDATELLVKLTQTLEPQVERHAEGLRLIVATATAIREVFPSGASAKFMHGAYLPVTDGSTEFDPALRDFRPANRLTVNPAMVTAARNEIAPQLAPVVEALKVAAQFQRFDRRTLKLEKYEIKGVVSDALVAPQGEIVAR
jgi:hypothetical protein